jgi:hypothetical protein
MVADARFFAPETGPLAGKPGRPNLGGANKMPAGGFVAITAGLTALYSGLIGRQAVGPSALYNGLSKCV